MKHLSWIIIFSLIILSCKNEFTIGYERKVEIEEHVFNSTKHYVGTSYYQIKKNSQQILFNSSQFSIKKVSFQNDSIWILDNVDLNRSRIGGCFYTAPKVPSVSYFLEDGNLNFILELGFQFAQCQSERIKVENLNYNFSNPIDSLNFQDVQIDTFKINPPKIMYAFESSVDLNKKIKFENSPEGLIIKEIETFSQNDLESLESIFGNGKYQVVEYIMYVDILKN